MKRILSTILVVVMLLSVCNVLTFSVSATETGKGVSYEVQTNGFKNGQITFDVYLSKNQTIYDSLLTIKYDSQVLEVVKADSAKTVDSDGNESDIVSGLYEHGIPEGDKSAYTFAYINSDANGFKVGNNIKKMYTITFKLKNKNASATTLKFVSGTYESTDVFKSFDNISTFNAPEISATSLKNGAVSISWKSVSGAQGYVIYKMTGNEMKKLASVDSKTTTYEDKAVSNGTTYVYGVASTDSKGNVSFYSTFEVTYIAPPKTSFEVVKTGVNVKWEKVANAEKYVVYKSVLTNGNWSNWSAVQTVSSTKTSWIDVDVDKGVTYKYAVSAIVKGVATGYANDASITFAPAVTSLATPKVAIKNSAKGIAVSWNEIEGAESYIVYRSVYNASTKKWSKWGAIKTGVTAVSYIDTTVKLGITYKYTVRAVNGDVKSSYVGSEALKYNVVPTVKIANTATGVKVAWSTAANATGYTVYRSQYNDKTKKWSGWKNMGTAKANKTAWVDKSVVSGTYYKYTVRAVNGKILSSYKASGSLLFLAQPTVKFANASAGVKVAWSKVKGATGYTVYRSELVDGKWTKWSNRGTAKADKSSWVDKKVESGVTYKYTVRAINGKVMSSYTDTKGLLYLAQPTVIVKAVTNGINVAWSQCEGATGYAVYRSQYNAKTKKWTKWQGMGTAKADRSNWTDKKATKGVTYKYTVRAVNADTGSKSTYVASKSVKR